MPNELKVKQGLIVDGSGSAVLEVNGVAGDLLTVYDQSEGVLLSVRDSSANPLFEVSSSGDIYMPQLSSSAQSYVLTYNSASGQIYYTASSTVGGGGGGGGPISVTGSTLYSNTPSADLNFSLTYQNSIFFGSGSGVIISGSSTGNSNLIFLGYQAGYSASINTQNSNFLGYQAGAYSFGYQSNFLGYQAGYSASIVLNSNFLGYQAGYLAKAANNSNFLGINAGYSASNAAQSNFLGTSAGNEATNAAQSNFIGTSAGQNAINSSGSNFIGHTVGQYASSASFSVLIGHNVANYSNAGIRNEQISSNNIIIGTGISLPRNRKDSINLGGIIFATGSYSVFNGSTPYTESAGGKVGINVVTPTATLQVSGSGPSGSLNVNNHFTINQTGNAYFSGSVGIGTNFTSPVTAGYRLEVSGSQLTRGSLVFLDPVETTQIRIGAGNAGIPGGSTDTPRQILIGNFVGGALQAGNLGDSLIAIGYGAANTITTGGRYSVFIGRNSGNGITTGGEGVTWIGSGDNNDTPSNLTSALILVGAAGLPNNNNPSIFGNLTSRFAIIGGGFGSYIRDFYFGGGPFITNPTNSHINFYAPSATGSNIAAADFTINAGRGSGTGSAGNIYFATSTTGSAGDTLQTLSTRMTIAGHTGNVGIGTTTPSSSLHVSGAIRIDDVLILPFQSPLPSNKPTGSIALSGSGGTFAGMFVYNGTAWVNVKA